MIVQILNLLFAALFGAVISAIASLFLQDNILFCMARFIHPFFGSIRGKTAKLNGIWESVYPEVDPEPGAERKQIKHLIYIQQVGDSVFGKNLEGRTNYTISAKIYGNQYLSGTWSDYTDGEHHGAFQLYIVNSGKTKTMQGIWIGFSTKRENLIRSGEWYWEFRDHL